MKKALVLFLLLFPVACQAGERITLEKGDSTEIGTALTPLYVYDENSAGGLYGSISDGVANQISFYTGTRTLGPTVSMVENNGNIGIGQASPTALLDVGGNIQFSGTLTGTSTTDIGGTIQTAANKPCNTTCVRACVLGQDTDTAPYPIVDCANATADRCYCLGPR